MRETPDQTIRQTGGCVGGAEAEILEYERRVNQALRAMAKRHYYTEPISLMEDKTPLSALVEAEEGGLDEWGIRNDSIRELMAYLAADGPHPAHILRRLWAVASHLSIEPFSASNLREQALMLGDSHESHHWRMKRLSGGA